LGSTPTTQTCYLRIGASVLGLIRQNQSFAKKMFPERATLKQHQVEEERELLHLLLQKEGLNSQRREIGPVETREPLPLSWAQRRLWFLDRLQPGSDFYNVVLACALLGDLNVPALEWSLQQIIHRHGALRTRFVVEDDEPMQRIETSIEFHLQVFDWANQEGPDSLRKRAEEIVAQEAAKPFDLGTAPLLRGVLIRLQEREYILELTIHHIVVDEWSMGVLQQEMALLYAAYLQGRESPLKQMPVQYADFTLWQARWFQGEVFLRQLEYWKKQLAGMPGLLEMPTDRPRSAMTRHGGSTAAVTVEREYWEKMKWFSRQEGASIFMTLLAIYQVLLLRYTGQTDFGVGTPVSNRNDVRMEGVIGFCVNTLIIRADLKGDPTFREALGRVKKTTLEAFDHQDLPLERLVEELSPERRVSGSPLFQVMFTFIAGKAVPLQLPGLQMRPIGPEATTSKYDVTLIAVENENNNGLAFNYDTALFEPDTIHRMFHHYGELLAAAITRPELRISDLPILTQDETRQLLVEWNRTDSAYEQKCVHELFEEQVRRSAEAVAVECDGQQLTYAELNRRANQLAHYLRRVGVEPEVRIGICMERSLEMVTGLLGILKAGGAFVALDPRYPAERLKLMVEDSAIALLVTQSGLLEQLPGSAKVICINKDEDSNEIARESGEDLGLPLHAQNLAYVIYTSGSTGRPRGVAIQHGSAHGLLQWAREVFSTEELGGVLASTSICFDLSVFELFVPLSWGGKTIIVRDALSLAEIGQDSGVKLLNTVPSAMAELLRIKGVPGSIRTVNLAGEALQPNMVEEIYDELKVEQVFNLYGPSETTTYSTYACLKRGEANGRAPIGKPISNTQAYVLDRAYQSLPVGAIGELYLGGHGIARGYLNRPELTAEKFVPNPFSERGGERMYRTGDQVKWRRNGDLEFLGRLDQQVKVRGYRIELGEIEAALNAYAGIGACAVVVREDQPEEKRVVAYLVKNGDVDAAALREFLKQRLPDFMVPCAFVEMKRLPLTPNGKVNRKALPVPRGGWSEKSYVGPRNGDEEILCSLFAEVLNRDQVGVHDDFFAMGGHSLLATKLVTRIRGALGVDVALRHVFESPTIARLATKLQPGGKAGISLRHHPKVERAPLSYSQRRLWFIHQQKGSSTEFNMPEALRLRGRLDVDALRRAVQTIVDRHECLRTHFAEENGAPVQIIAPSFAVDIPIQDVSRLSETEQQRQVMASMNNEWREPFDLTHGPVLRVKLLRLAEDEHILLRTFHHIVSDGWSQGVFMRELRDLYEAYSQGRENPLPDLPLQFADFALWQTQQSSEGLWDEELRFWKEHLAQIPEELEIPRDRPRPAVKVFAAKACGITLPAPRLAALKRCGRSTLYMTLLTAFAVLLHRYSGQDEIVVGSPIANRQDERLEGLIGFFANMLVMRVGVNPKASFRELLEQVRELALEAYRHQHLPFERLLEELSLHENLDRPPLFQAIFALQNASSETQELRGLKIEPLGTEELSVRFDLEVHAVERDAQLEILWVYNADLFDGWRIERMARHYERLLAAVVQDLDKPVGDLQMLSASEMQQPRFPERLLKKCLPEELC
jgi:amino acid adenylation domain-containing protein